MLILLHVSCLSCNSYIANPLPGSGSLAAGGYQVTIDGTPMDQEAAFPISAGTTYNVKIAQGTGNSMRGFLIRASGGSTEVDTVTALGIDEPEATQVAESCLSQVTPVGGLTHTNNLEKAEAGGTLSFNELASDVILDITVVERLLGSDSVYYHTSYKLNII